MQLEPVAIMVPVPHWQTGFEWYKKAFPEAETILLPESDFRALKIGEFTIEVVSSDEKVPSAMAGTVLYWSVDDLCLAIEHFKSLGHLFIVDQ